MPTQAPSSAHDHVLACPVCGGLNVHPIRLSCVSPGQSHGVITIDSHGVAMDPLHEPIGRGVWIALAFACEDGHLFEQRLHFHKGSTTLEQVVDRRASPSWMTIWRD